MGEHRALSATLALKGVLLFRKREVCCAAPLCTQALLLSLSSPPCCSPARVYVGGATARARPLAPATTHNPTCAHVASKRTRPAARARTCALRSSIVRNSMRLELVSRSTSQFSWKACSYSCSARACRSASRLAASARARAASPARRCSGVSRVLTCSQQGGRLVVEGGAVLWWHRGRGLPGSGAGQGRCWWRASAVLQSTRAPVLAHPSPRPSSSHCAGSPELRRPCLPRRAGSPAQRVGPGPPRTACPPARAALRPGPLYAGP